MTLLRLLGIGLLIALGCSTTLSAEDWIAPAAAAAVANPVPSNAESISSGKSSYERNCLICHGATGLGDGAGGAYLAPKPTNLANSVFQKQSDGAIFWKVSTGRGLMMGYAAMLKEQERWHLVNYMRSLTPPAAK